jgi:hypothetical protein
MYSWSSWALGGHGQDGEQHRAHPAGVVDPGQRARQKLQLDPSGLQGAGEGHQLGGVAGQALHLVHGQDHGLARRGALAGLSQPAVYERDTRPGHDL